ncbi:HAD family phosphatase [Actinoplanes sp. NPDC051851]|uniref:HAD family hydrolase n=1 Tax=Actinoplanes sp. NPDC051851 TaxID=3154753 RepID=UPI003422E776
MITTGRAIIFDAEGVVVDTEGAWDAAQAELLNRRGRAYPRDTLKPLLTGRGERAAIEIIIDVCGLDDEPDALAAERRVLMAALLARSVRFVPGFREYFATVHPEVGTCVATSMEPSLLALADTATGLSRLFGGRVVDLSVPGVRPKPAPDVFLLAAERLGVPPADCVVIEDSATGVAAARAAGMRCVGLATTHPAEILAGADVTALSWADVPPVHPAPR